MSRLRPTGGKLLGAFALTLAVLAAYTMTADAPALRIVEGQLLNWRFAIRGPVAPGRETAIVAIDDASVRALGRWPLSRRHMAAAVRQLAADGASVIAFDLLFLEPEPVVQPDTIFGRAIGQAGPVIVPYAFVFGSDLGPKDAPPAFVAESAYRIYTEAEGAVADIDPTPSDVAAPIPAIADPAVGAHVNVVLDHDGSLRFAHPVIAYGDNFYPSLPIEAVRLYRGLGKDEVTLRVGEGIAIGDQFVPTDSAMRLAPNYHGAAGSFETHSFVDLVQGRIPAGTFTDRIVLIGTTVLGVGDVFQSPFSSQLPGVEHYATVVDNILHGRGLIHGDRVAAWDFTAILVAGLLAAWLTVAIRTPVLAGLGVLALLAASGAINAMLFTTANLWLNLTFPTGAILLNASAFGAVNALIETRRRRTAERQRGNLARYVPSTVAQSLADRDQPFADDRTLDAAVMFVDLVGFTKLSEDLAPAEAMELLRQFHRRVETAVLDHGGTLDKFIGDGAMAIFGVPVPDPTDAGRAIDCARALAEDVAQWRDDLERTGRSPVSIGVGLHYGPVVVGEVGGERQIQFTAVGDTVNVASRLESLTRSHDATIIASDSLVEAARAAGAASAAALHGFIARPPAQVRNRREPIEIWAWSESG